MNKQYFKIVCMITGLLLISGLVSCDSGYRKATVIKMFAVYTPDNLSDSSECQELWNTIDSLGTEMDEIRDDWNQVILENAYQLIEKGCVKDKYEE